MKKIHVFFYLFLVPAYAFASGELVSTKSLQSWYQLRQGSMFVNRHGIHQFFVDVQNPASYTLAYFYFPNYANFPSMFSTVSIDQSILLSKTAITGDDDRLLVVYGKETKIYVKQSLDNGLSWSTLSFVDFPLGDDTVYGIDALYIRSGDASGLNVVYSTGHSGVDPEVYFRRFDFGDNTWKDFKIITDENTGGTYGKIPSIAFSSGKIHVSYTKTQGTFGETRVRERSISPPTWEPSYNISAISGSSGIASLVVVGNFLHVLVNGQSGSNVFVHYIRRDISTGSQTAPLQLSNRSVSQHAVKLVRRANGGVMAIFIEYFENIMWLSSTEYDGSSWSTLISWGWGPSPGGDLADFAASSVGNDIYAYYWTNSGGGSWFLGNGPIVKPSTPAISGSVGQHPTISWSANPEPDLSGYKLYREIMPDESQFSLVATLSTSQTSWTDIYVTIRTGGTAGQWARYYVKAYDNASNLSDQSNTVYKAVNYMPPEIGGPKSPEELVSKATPEQFALTQNYPNPFNPATEITVALPEASTVSLVVYDVLGREVRSLLSGTLSEGYYSVSFDGARLPSGVYFYRLTATLLEGSRATFVQIRKMILSK